MHIIICFFGIRYRTVSYSKTCYKYLIPGLRAALRREGTDRNPCNPQGEPISIKSFQVIVLSAILVRMSLGLVWAALGMSFLLDLRVLMSRPD
jgi:hypothetical protein